LDEIARKAEALRAQADVAEDKDTLDEGYNVDQLPPLAGDYHGLGGPESVPLCVPRGSPFSAPPATGKNLLDELYLAPTSQQVAAFRRLEAARAK